MEIKSVALMGAGAIGAYFIRGLSDCEGIDFAVVAKGSRADRLRSEGIVINGQTCLPHVLSPEEARGADLLIISVKYDALKSSLDQIETIVGPGTVVLSVLNGVTSEEIVAERIGESHIVYSFMRLVSRRVGREIMIDLSPHLGVVMGEKGESEPSERMKAIGELFDKAGIHYVFSPDIEADMWGKFIINVSRNLPQAVLGIGAGCYDDSEYMGYLCKKLREEVAAVARAKGIEVDPDKSVIVITDPLGKRARYSTLQDLDASRHSEIDMFAGNLIRLGMELGVPTPFAESVYCLIKAREEAIDGRFDY